MERVTLHSCGSRFRTVALVVALLGGTAGAAWAQDDVASAREHFARGTRAYDLGQYEEAIKEYQAAYRAKDDPAILFNIGQAYRGAGDAQSAIESYRSYLRKVPGAPNRPEVEERIVELRRVVEHQRKPSPTPASAPPTAPTVVVIQQPREAAPAMVATRGPNADELRAARRKRIAGLVVGGIGVVALGLGGAFDGIAMSANQHIVSRDGWSTGEQSKRDDFQNGAIGAYAFGGTALLTGVVLYLVGHHEAHSQYPMNQSTAAPAHRPLYGKLLTVGAF